MSKNKTPAEGKSKPKNPRKNIKKTRKPLDNFVHEHVRNYLPRRRSNEALLDVVPEVTSQVSQHFPWGLPPYTKEGLRRKIMSYSEKKLRVHKLPKHPVDPKAEPQSQAKASKIASHGSGKGCNAEVTQDMNQNGGVQKTCHQENAPRQIGPNPSYVSSFQYGTCISRFRFLSGEGAFHVGSGSALWIAKDAPKIKWYPPDILAERKLPAIFFSELTKIDVPHFRHPLHVEEIHFDSSITQPSFLRILRYVQNLRALEIHCSTLHFLYFDKSSAACLNSLHLPKLQSLEISSSGLTSEDTRKYDMTRVIHNTIYILQMIFPALQYLGISLPYAVGSERLFTKSTWDCVVKHKATLQILNLECLFSEHEACSVGIDPEIISGRIGGAKDVKLVNFHFFSSARLGSTDFWRRFLKTQDRLKYIQFWAEGSCHYRFPYDIVTNNYSQLETLSMNINVQSHQDCNTLTPMDFSVFSNMPRLNTLALKGCSNISPPISDSSKPDILNIQALPPQMKVIKLIHLRMTSADLDFLVSNQSQLETLLLDTAGTENNLGVTLTAIVKLLENASGSLTSLELYDSINEASLARGWSTSKTSRKSSYEDRGYKLLSKFLKNKPCNPSLRAYRAKGQDFKIFFQQDESHTDDNKNTVQVDPATTQSQKLVPNTNIPMTKQLTRHLLQAEPSMDEPTD